MTPAPSPASVARAKERVKLCSAPTCQPPTFICSNHQEVAQALDAARKDGALEEAAKHADCCVAREEKEMAVRHARRATWEAAEREQPKDWGSIVLDAIHKGIGLDVEALIKAKNGVNAQDVIDKFDALRAEVEVLKTFAQDRATRAADLAAEIARLREAIEQHTCAANARWCGTHGQYHGDALCAALFTPPDAPGQG